MSMYAPQVFAHSASAHIAVPIALNAGLPGLLLGACFVVAPAPVAFVPAAGDPFAAAASVGGMIGFSAMALMVIPKAFYATKKFQVIGTRSAPENQLGTSRLPRSPLHWKINFRPN